MLGHAPRPPRLCREQLLTALNHTPIRHQAEEISVPRRLITTAFVDFKELW